MDERPGASVRDTLVTPSGSSGPSSDDSLLRAIAGAPPRALGPAHLLAPGVVVADRYRIEALLGTGGMGAVFRAVDRRLQRPVALKVHHGRAASLVRLRHEARLLARLSHPNVVTVLEVVVHDGAPVVVMEYVEGGSARRWARDVGRTWQQILAVYIQAARGLAAAHAIGIVHRDFKPDNLLVGGDGRARVADFGLADGRSPGELDDVIKRSLVGARDSSVDASPDATDPSALVGTPAYVAPEQIISSKVDARADQFSFCAALFEAVYGVLPFPGNSALEMVGHILDGARIDPPSRRGVPGWLHAVIVRGMATRPEDRFVDMDALRGALERPPTRRAAAFVVGGALVLGAAAVAFGAQPQTDPRCDDDATPGWTALRAPIGDRIGEQAGRRTDADGEALRAQWTRLDRRLDHRGQAWSAAWVTACAAQREGVTAVGLTTMAQRLDCLDGERRFTDALLAELEEPDAAAVARMLESSTRWDDPLACIATIPDDAAENAAAAGSSDRSLTEDTVLLEARAALAAGRSVTANTLADLALVEAQKSGDETRIAAALLVRARTRFEIGQHERALDDATAAVGLAQQTGDVETARDAALLLASAYGHDDPAQSLRWIPVARRYLRRWPDDAARQVELLAIEAGARRLRGERDAAGILLDEADSIAGRAGVPGGVTAKLWFERVELAVERSDFGVALDHAERARGLLEAEYGPGHYRVGAAYSKLGYVYDHAGNYTEARDQHRRALALFEGPGGGIDRRTVLQRVGLAALETLLGNSTQALVELDAARAAIDATGLDARDILAVEAEARGMALLDLERFDEAHAAFEELLHLSEAQWGSSHPAVRGALLNLALTERSRGHADEADAALVQAVRIQEGLPEGDPLAADVYHGYGFALLDRGELDGAEVQFERATAALRDSARDGGVDDGWPALGLGRVALRRDRPAEALVWFERAAVAWSSDDADPRARADLAESTAAALWALGRSDEAIATARAALLDRPGHVLLRAWLERQAPGAAPPR